MTRLYRFLLCAGCVALCLLSLPTEAAARPFWWDDQPYDNNNNHRRYRYGRNRHNNGNHRYYRQSSRNRFQLGATAIYTVPLQDANYNVWGPGVGLRAGYTSDGGMYMGILGDMHLGETERSRGFEYSVQGFFIGGEFGYDIRLGRHGALRPSMSAGVHILSTTYDSGRGSDNETVDDLFVRPGLDLVWTTDDMYLGPQIHFNVIMAEQETVTSFMLAFTVGAAM